MRKLFARLVKRWGFVPIEMMIRQGDLHGDELMKERAARVAVEFRAEQETLRHVRAELAQARVIGVLLEEMATRPIPVVTRGA